jgi:type I restriction enzyme S subunit
MTATHETGTIDELCDVEYGTRVVRKRDAGSTYPVYGGGGETFYLDSFNRENRVVIARFAMSEKCTRKVLGKFALNDSGLTLSPKNTESLRQDYLDYWILSLNDVIYEKARGTAQKNLDMSAFREIELSFPRSIEKQKLVVEILDKAFAEIDSLEKNLQLKEERTNQLLQSMLSAAFTNTGEFDMKVVKLGDICSTINGLWTGKKPPFEKVFVIRNTNFTKDCKLNLENVAELSVETKQLATRKLRSGDLIVEKSGGGPKQAVGRVVLFSEEGENYSLSNFTSALRIKDLSKFIPKFIQLFLFLQYMSGKTETMQSNSTGIRNLNMNQFLDVEIPIPSIESQEKIVNRLDKAFVEIEKLKSQILIEQERISSLRQSILSNAFNFEETAA